MPIRLPLTTPVEIVNAVVAGWTGRDRAAVDHHIAELKAIGVTPPSTVPVFYRIGSGLFTTEAVIDVVGDTSSGEVEPVLIDNGEALFLGLGSDHTDRTLEAYSVAASKQACPKPMAAGIWRFAEVADHLDRIELRSWQRDDANAEWTPYQDGTLASIRSLTELIAKCGFAIAPDRLQPGTAMMCGTLGVLSGGVRPSRFFRIEMHDPVLDRTLGHVYESHVLPVVS